MSDQDQAFKASVIRNFSTADGRLQSIPVQRKKKLIILEYLIFKLEPGRPYPEKEINMFIKGFHEDFATIRREFIVHGFMTRENEVYMLAPQDDWAT
ncbi:DUF2087 domain-containing protein [Paenibacillus sp. NPDC057934]|uniref:DUF2087 domain-containing protein n=1 Tax=Paenibacillus sp. NPDC057934 TaxID=3346282 RepID=UPI0036D81B15